MLALRYLGGDIVYNAQGVHGTRLVHGKALEELIDAHLRGRLMQRYTHSRDAGTQCAPAR
jgi:hypothetical protein